MSDKEQANQTGVHKVKGKAPKSDPKSGTEQKKSEAAEAAKEASRSDDTIVSPPASLV